MKFRQPKPVFRPTRAQKQANRKLERFLDNHPMKEFELSHRKIEDHINALLSISRPHPQTTTDGKTVTRDFDIPPKAGTMLARDLKSLKKVFEEKEEVRLDMIMKFLPRGQENHTPEERAEFQKAFESLMNEVKKVSLHQVILSYEKTTRPDAIDLTKAQIPFHLYADLLDTVLVDEEFGNSEIKAVA